MKYLYFFALVCLASMVSASEWTVAIDESTHRLTLTAEEVQIQGTLAIRHGKELYTLVKSRDGVPERAAFINPAGNVQAYVTFPQNGRHLQIFVYHRTAQNFEGTIEFKGTVHSTEAGFACKTKPRTRERVLGLQMKGAHAANNDSIFAPQKDTVLRFEAATLSLVQTRATDYALTLCGQIREAAESHFTVSYESDYFKNRYSPYYHALDRVRCPKAPTGWMSWNTYFDRATAEDNLAEARIGKQYLQPFGCEFWSIESWQGNSDQLPVSKFFNMDLEVNERQFPNGMKNLADEIRALGFRPGLWTAPFGTGNTNFYLAHKSWFLHTSDGTPIKSWNGVFTLDPTVPEARAHLRNIHAHAAQEWGYEFFKIDGMSGRNHGYCAHLYERPEIRARFSDPACPNPFELCVQAFREGIGSNCVFLACQGHATGPEPRYADAARSGADIVHPNQPVKWENVKNQAICTLAQAFTHNIATVLDPDTLLVRDLPLEEARTSAAIVALPGQLTFFGDKLKDLPPEKMKILQQTLPAVQVVPQSLYPYFSLLPIWKIEVAHPQLHAYTVAALFNWDDHEADVTAFRDELGFGDGRYLAYEFWTGTVQPLQSQLKATIPAHGVRIFALHRDHAIPCWLGSDRHVSVSGMEVTACAWDAARKTLSGEITVIGGFPLTTAFHLPAGYTVKSIHTNADSNENRERDSALYLTLQAKQTKRVTFEIQF